jgi:hypothetical protein
VGRLVEVLAVEVEETAPDPLLGASVDTPTAGRRLAAHALEIGGWALGAGGAVEGIKVALDERVLAEAVVGQPRDDIGAAYPDVDGADRAGFEVAVDASRLPAEAELEVWATVDSATATIGRLRLRRCWRGELHRDRPPLVSLVVVRDSADQDLEATLRSLEAQRYPMTELVVVDSPTSAEQGPAQLRNEALRRSNGDLVLFLPAGAMLSGDALTGAVERLIEKPGACGVIDGDADGPVGAAVYRRSAFEELRGFRAAAGERCERELADRAADYDALFVPGALREDEG